MKVNQKLALLLLCRRNADVIESKVFPFLDLRDHIRLACASSVFLQQSGLKPPPHPLPPAPPLPRHVIKYGAWKKSVRLPPQVTNSQLMLFCGFAQSVHKLDLTHCQQITDISALGNIPTLQTLNLRGCWRMYQHWAIFLPSTPLTSVVVVSWMCLHFRKFLN